MKLPKLGKMLDGSSVLGNFGNVASPIGNDWQVNESSNNFSTKIVTHLMLR
jgi:hypothetical protein